MFIRRTYVRNENIEANSPTAAPQASSARTVSVNDRAPSGDRATHPAYYVQSLARGLSVIKTFGPSTPELTLSEVARAAGLTRAGARRFLLTLVDLGYLRTNGKRFSLTAKVLDLGYSFLSSASLPAMAEPHLEKLVKQTDESSSVSVLDGTDIVYVARVPVSRIMSVAIGVGTRFPAYATSMGQVLLAAMEPDELDDYLAAATLQALTRNTITDEEALRARLRDVASNGYALVDQELELGLRSIAVPIHDKAGSVVAAMNVSTQVSRVRKVDVVHRFLKPLRQAAAAIQEDLGRT